VRWACYLRAAGHVFGLTVLSGTLIVLALISTRAVRRICHVRRWKK
jgi:hypothetical protein